MTDTAYFGGGCFWCTEAIFQRVKGVTNVISGYAGGEIENPDYEKVSSGQTGHAEAIKIIYDPKLINYKDLLFIFFRTHDPTTKDQQGHDIGNQYRSVIFFTDQNQESEAKNAIIDAQKIYSEPLVTEIVKLDKFYEAENYHQNYYNSNKDKPYCKFVIDPKIDKLRSEYLKYLKWIIFKATLKLSAH